MRLFFSERTVFYAPGDDEQLTRTKGDITLAHTDGDVPFEDKEEIIRVVVRVPDELTFDLDDHKIVAIELSDDTRLPITFEGSELFRKIDGRHGIQATR